MRFPRTFRFASLVSISMAALLVLAIGIVSLNYSYFERSNVESLTNLIMQQAAARVEHRIDQLLGEVEDVNEESLRMMRERRAEPTSLDQIAHFLGHECDAYDDIAWNAYVSATTGEYVELRRLPDSTMAVHACVRGTDGVLSVEDRSWSEDLSEPIATGPWDGSDRRQERWYAQVKATRAQQWIEPRPIGTALTDSSSKFIIRATPDLDAQGTLVGVFASGIDTRTLTRFVTNVSGDVPGKAFVAGQNANGKYMLIAHPDETLLPPGKDARLAALDIRDTVAATFLRNLSASGVTLSRSIDHAIRFSWDGRGYIGTFVLSRKAGRPPWIMGLVLPNEEMLSDVRRNDRRSLLIGLSALVFVLLLAARLAARISRPLAAVSNEARAIGRFGSAQPLPRNVGIVEVDQLIRSMTDMRTNLRSFQKFVPSAVVRELVANGVEAHPDGRRAELTMLFTDIADFSLCAERMEPEALAEQLSEYFSTLSAAVVACNGTIDKFIGDGMMAFWGAPQADQANAENACRAALRMQAALAELNRRRIIEGHPAFHTRMGLHTGLVVIGNFGSDARLNYTAIGDSVNLASRLEGVNKLFGTSILISDDTARAAGDMVLTRPVDRIVVRGRNADLLVHELVCMRSEATDEVLRSITETTSAFERYAGGDKAGAIIGYNALRERDPSDGLAKEMLLRCRERVAIAEPDQGDS